MDGRASLEKIRSPNENWSVSVYRTEALGPLTVPLARRNPGDTPNTVLQLFRAQKLESEIRLRARLHAVERALWAWPAAGKDIRERFEIIITHVSRLLPL